MSAPTSGHPFCGAGGDSLGFARAGFDVWLGANHWNRAIETHAANFPDAEHLCQDLDRYDMRRLPKTDVLVGSPICTESSPADGVARPKKAPTPGQLDLLEQGSVADAAWERTRATAYDILRAVEVHDYLAVVCENVPRFATAWPPVLLVAPGHGGPRLPPSGRVGVGGACGRRRQHPGRAVAGPDLHRVHQDQAPPPHEQEQTF